MLKPNRFLFLCTFCVYLFDCAKAGNETVLPDKTWFLENLFDKYTNSNTSTITIDDFKSLMSDMGLDTTALTSDETSSSNTHGHKRNDNFQKCYSANELLDIYELASMELSTSEELKSILPSLVYLNVQKLCLSDDKAETTKRNTNAEKYGYGTIAVTIVTLLSILGIIILPCFNTSVYEQILTIFSALAAGTLLSDATLHLVPAIMGLEDHNHGHSGEDTDDSIHIPTYVFRLVVLLGSLYAFWLLEVLFARFTGGHGHSHSLHPSDSHALEAPQQNIRPVYQNVIVGGLPTNRQTSSLHNHQTQQNLGFKQRMSQIKPTAWMILFGDAIHNLADGLAIGASFADSNSLGISTTIAIVLHEIPHELGDYAVLIKCGFTHKQGLVVNFLSALTCYIGFYIGASISSNEEVSLWIFAATAGMFYYIALVDLFPELLLHSNGKWTWKYFLVINMSLWIGFAIMFLLVVFEEKILV